MEMQSLKLWRHYRDTPFEVMSVILLSALTLAAQVQH